MGDLRPRPGHQPRPRRPEPRPARHRVGPREGRDDRLRPTGAMFGPGLADPQTLTYIERLGGQTAVLQDQVNRSPYLLGLQTSRSTLAQWRPSSPSRSPASCPPTAALVFYSNRPPFTVHWRSARPRPPPGRQDPAPPAPRPARRSTPSPPPTRTGPSTPPPDQATGHRHRRDPPRHRGPLVRRRPPSECWPARALKLLEAARALRGELGTTLVVVGRHRASLGFRSLWRAPSWRQTVKAMGAARVLPRRRYTPAFTEGSSRSRRRKRCSGHR
jgi:hypothetical protein